MSKLLFLASTVGALALSTGCVIDSSDAPPRVQQTGGTPSATPDPQPNPDPTETQPLIVEIDPDRTMSAVGGEGVGVFVEYATGGKWHVFWTCDTTISGQPCQFLLRMTATRGELSLPKDPSVDPAAAYEFESLTRTEVNEAYFDAQPGSDVEIEAVIGGKHDSRFFFFVQNGAVNGDYTGILTDPLIFRPKGGK